MLGGIGFTMSIFITNLAFRRQRAAANHGLEDGDPDGLDERRRAGLCMCGGVFARMAKSKRGEGVWRKQPKHRTNLGFAVGALLAPGSAARCFSWRIRMPPQHGEHDEEIPM